MVTKPSPPPSFLPNPGTVSVTVVHDSTMSYGLRLARQEPKDNSNSNSNSSTNQPQTEIAIDMIASHHKNGLLKDCPLREGDTLKTINNRVAHRFLGGGLTGYLKCASFRDGDPVTFVVVPDQNQNQNEGEDDEDECNSAIVRAFCRFPITTNSNSNSNSNSNTEESILKRVGLCFHRVVVEDDGEQHSHTTTDDNNNNDCDTATASSWSDDDSFKSMDDESDSESEEVSRSSSSSYLAFGESSQRSSRCSATTTRSSSYSSSFLQIDRIDPNGIFAHSVLNQGDILLAINGHSICADEETTVEEAYQWLVSTCKTTKSTNTTTTVDIVALNPRKLMQARTKQKGESLFAYRRSQERKRWMRKQVKRAGVAVGGGAMIGVGLVFHPAGGLCLTSGVSLLATEFETPNRMVKSARNSLEQWIIEGDANATEKTQAAKQVEASLELSRKIALSGETKTTDYRRGKFRSIVNLPNNETSASSKKSWEKSMTLSPHPMSQQQQQQHNRMTTVVKGFGRNYILPLLDKMAGDRSDVHSSMAKATSESLQNCNLHSSPTEQEQERDAPVYNIPKDHHRR